MRHFLRPVAPCHLILFLCLHVAHGSAHADAGSEETARGWEQAARALVAGDLGEAKQIAESMVEGPRRHYLLGTLARLRGDAQAGEASLEACVSRSVEEPTLRARCLVGLGQLLEQDRSRLTPAKAHYRRILELPAGIPDTFRSLAEARIEMIDRLLQSLEQAQAVRTRAEERESPSP